jgi:hypothetical protein
MSCIVVVDWQLHDRDEFLTEIKECMLQS